MRFIENYWHAMPDEVPDEYSRPDGTAYWCEVDEETYNKVWKSQNGVRSHEKLYLGSGGTDGWQALRGGGHGKR